MFLLPARGEPAETSARESAQRAQLLSRALRSGACGLAVEQQALRIDRAVRESRHMGHRQRDWVALEGFRTPADDYYVFARPRDESGFGLIELLMAMVMLNIGILAIVAAFNSGILTSNRRPRCLRHLSWPISRWSCSGADVRQDRARLDSPRVDEQHAWRLGTWKRACPYSTAGEVTMTCSVVNTCTPWRDHDSGP